MGHWYTQTGEPCHFVEGKNGMRGATLRDARKLGLVPGFSGVTSILSKPGLDKWKENQILEAAWLETVDREDCEFPDWKSNVKALANERSLKARDRGSEIHDAIEQFIKIGGEDIDIEFHQYLGNLGSALQKELGLDLRTLEAETTFSSALGYGGMIDGLDRSYRRPMKKAMPDPIGILLDWKTKDKEWDEKTKLAYDDHGMQLSAYREGVGLPYATCVNVFISPSAQIKIHVWGEADLILLFEKFKTCLRLWQIDRKYDSGFQ